VATLEGSVLQTLHIKLESRLQCNVYITLAFRTRVLSGLA
jgi:hypothetical protein